MSIKNQRPLLISAAAIIGLTVASLFGLNIVVDKISRINPPSIAMVEPVRPPAKMGAPDDAIERPRMPAMGIPQDGMPPSPDFDPRARPRMPDPRAQPDDALRRIRNGKDAPDIRRTQPAPRPTNGRDDAVENGQKQMPKPPAAPPNMGNGYFPPPYPFPENMDPQERDRIERELERRREMFNNGQPPPGYPPPGYPPPGYPPPPYPGEPPPYYDNYDYHDEYYDEYQDYEDFDSRRDDPRDANEKTATLNEQEFDDENVYDPDLEDAYEYVNDTYED